MRDRVPLPDSGLDLLLAVLESRGPYREWKLRSDSINGWPQIKGTGGAVLMGGWLCVDLRRVGIGLGHMIYRWEVDADMVGGYACAGHGMLAWFLVPWIQMKNYIR